MKPLHGLLLLALAGQACVSDTSVVARAGNHTLTVGRLAELVGPARAIPLETDDVYGVALRWVEYSIFGDSTAHGADLLDSSIAVAAQWPEYRRAVVDSFRLTLIRERIEVDSAEVREMYQDDGLRRVSHVLVKSDRSRAQTLRRRLLGGEPWSVINRFNEDDVARANNGSLGVIPRNATVPSFETAAFALNPGGVSDVVSSEFGYHIIYRPPLHEVWEEFEDLVRARAVRAFDSTYKAELAERRDLELVENAVELARAAAENPRMASDNHAPLARYDTGVFTVHRFGEWIHHVLEARFRRELRRASEDAAVRFLRDLVQQELMYEEAAAAGVTIPSVALADLAARHEEQLLLVRMATGLFADSIAPAGAPLEERVQRAQARVDDYLARVLQRLPDFVPVPAFLADTLLARSDWTVYEGRIDAVMERAQPIRDSVLATPLAPGSPGSTR